MSADDFGKDIVINKYGDLIVPLFAGEHFLGALRVKKGSSLGEEEQLSIQNMFTKVGSALLDASLSLNRQESQDTIESRKHIINLIGGTDGQRHQLAIRVQELLGAWSFVSWTDSGIAQWNTEDMDDLANITIYIRDILELSPKERQQLSTLQKLPSSLRPHLIIGSDRAISQYLQDSTLEPEFQASLAMTSIFTEQLPKDYLRLREVLEMLMEDDSIPTPIEHRLS